MSQVPTTTHGEETVSQDETVFTPSFSGSTFILDVQAGFYGLEVLFAAAYVFLDRAYIFFDGEPKGTVRITFEPKAETSPEKMQALFGDFKNELLAVRVRNTIAERNKVVREYIVSSVLGSAVPEEQFGFGPDLGIPLEDPLKNS
jgi:His-Xaa-Ser system protein HxsD